MSSSILVSGSIAYDYIMQYDGHFADHILTDKLDQLNVCYVVDQLHRYQWWAASNICYTLQLLWQSAFLLGSVGYDYDLSYFHNRSNIDTSHILQHQYLTTASFFGTSDRRSNQLMFFSPGAMSDSSNIQAPMDETIQYVIIAPDDPNTMMLRLDQYYNHSAQIIRDPWQQISNLTTEQLKISCQKADILIVNNYEYDLIQKKTGYDHRTLVSFYSQIIVTAGSDWSKRDHHDQEVHIPAINYDGVVYPTGAGDAYRAGLLHGLIRHDGDRDQSMQIASLMGRYAIQHHGWQQHIITENV